MLEFIRKILCRRVPELKLKNGNGNLQKLKDLTEELSARSFSLKVSEEQLAWELMGSRILDEVMHHLISPIQKIEDLSTLILEAGRKLTKSDHGFVSSIDPSTKINIEHTHTDVIKECSFVNEKAETSIMSDGTYPCLCGHALNTKEAFYTNDPQNHLAYKKSNSSHASVRNFLAAPAIFEGEIVGEIVFINCPGGFVDRELEMIKKLADIYSIVVHRFRKRQETNKREKAIKSVLETFQYVIEYSSNPIFWVNKNASFIYTNQKASETLEYTKEELLKMTVFDIDPIYSDQIIWKKHWKELKQKKILMFETKHKTKKGKIIPVKIVANYLEYKEKEINIASIEVLPKISTRTRKK